MDVESWVALEKFQATESQERRIIERRINGLKGELEVLAREVKAAVLMSDPARKKKAEGMIEERQERLVEEQAALEALTSADLIEAVWQEGLEKQAILAEEFAGVMERVNQLQADYVAAIKEAEALVHNHNKVGRLMVKARKVGGEDVLPPPDPKMPTLSLLTISQADLKSGKAPLAVKAAQDNIVRKAVSKMTDRDKYPPSLLSLSDEELKQFGVTRKKLLEIYPEAAPPPPLKGRRSGLYSTKA